MRHRVEAVNRPNGLYANWRGQTFQAQRSTTDGTLLLVASSVTQAPAAFDQEWDARPAKVVTEVEASSLFSLHTHCLFDDENYRIAGQDSTGLLTLQWTRGDENVAKQLGLNNLTTTASADQLAAIWQTRHDFPSAASNSSRSDEVPDQNALLRQIGRLLTSAAPTGWQRVAAQFRKLGDYTEIEIRTDLSTQDNEVEIRYSLASPELGQLFSELRSAMYHPIAGTWLQGTLTIQSDSTFSFDYHLDTEPLWRLAPQNNDATSDSARLELERFPRDRDRVPAWLAADAGLPLNIRFRRSEPLEIPAGDFNFERVSAEETQGVMHYLYRSPVVLSSPEPLQDALNSAAPPDVPDAFHTDSTWIWPASVPHYLRKYGIPPQPDLLAHIRAASFQPPLVSEPVRATAEAELLDKPYPSQLRKDLPTTDPVSLLNRGQIPPRALHASEVLEILRQRVRELGIPETAYRIGEREAGIWSMFRTKSSWQVLGPDDQVADFARIGEAARFLLGSLALLPTQFSPVEAARAIRPFRGEPPLSLLRKQRSILLYPGLKLLRFGDERGNLLHENAALFEETSLVATRARWRQEYEVVHPIEALTGVTQAWGDSPGGAVAYYLPEAIGRYVESGALIKK